MHVQEKDTVELSLLEMRAHHQLELQALSLRDTLVAFQEVINWTSHPTAD